MRSATLLKRNLTYFWRTNLAVVLGVAAAVAVLAGALIVGDSVRASLSALFLQRLGRTDQVVASVNFFREQLGDDLMADNRFAAAEFDGACPLIAIEGAATHEESGRRGTRVQVYGIDERFWKFHGTENIAARSLGDEEAFMSTDLAVELGAGAGDVLLLRLEKPSAIPTESLHGRKEDVGRTVRLSVRGALPAEALGEFSLRPQQSGVRAVFVPLRLLQKSLEQEAKVNTLLISAVEEAESSSQGERAASRSESLQKLLGEKFTLADLGVKVRPLAEGKGIAVESESALINDSLAGAANEAARGLKMRTMPVLSYLANSISANGREIPYSLVTAFDEESFARLQNVASQTVTQNDASPRAGETGAAAPSETAVSETTPTLPPIILNRWAANDLGAKTGDAVTLAYYLWGADGRLVTETAQFQLRGVVPIEGAAADRDFVPEYPGITGSESLASWDPPFPVDLSRIRPRDEDYWDEYRTTPKAFITLAEGQRLWSTRFGKLTSMRVVPPEGLSPERALGEYQAALLRSLDPTQGGLMTYPVRAEGLEASRGATNFGEYFLYFSFFLIVSALLLTGLFFRLGVEQRLREIGILQSLGFPAAQVRKIFLGEALVLTVAGSLLGLLGAYLYGKLMMLGLRTWWVGAVGTTNLNLHASPKSFLLGAAGGMLAALVCLVWTLRSLSRRSARSLLTGAALTEPRANAQPTSGAGISGRLGRLITARRAAVVAGALGLLLLLTSSLGLVGQAAGFFGGGALLLVSLLCFQSAWLRRRERGSIGGAGGWWPVARLGVRNATHRPGRSVLCITLIAFASFLIVAVDSFRRDDKTATLDKKSGTGGYSLMAESLLPLAHDPNTAEGREAFNLPEGGGEESGALAGVSFARFRLKPGDDASCLNLYQPQEPRILAPTDDFIGQGRFAFQDSLAATDEEKGNPWLLLRREFADGAIPVIADANSMTYVLHRKLGEDLVINRGGEELRLRFVGALADSIFQGELLMSEKNFLRHFPDQEGYKFFLLDGASPERASETAAVLEERLADFGFDVMSPAERLQTFHRVENTFLSTFQMLGALGLVLGTVGLAAVLLRNVLERRRELALLRAVGYQRGHFALMVIAENALLLLCGLATGVACALLAVAPVISARGGGFPFLSLGALLSAVVVSGLLASLLATVAALRSPLIPALRAE